MSVLQSAYDYLQAGSDWATKMNVADARYTLVAFVVTHWILSSSVSLLNVSNLNKPLDPLIPKLYGPSVLTKYEKSKAYIREKNTFGEIHGAFSQAVSFAYWFLAGYPWLDQQVKAFLPADTSPALLGTVYLLALMQFSSFLELPWGYYSNFVLEEKYGFNRMTMKTWVKDTLKGYALQIVLGGLFFYVFFLILTNYAVEQYWWLLASFIMGFQLIMLPLQPLIMKLFVEFIAIEKGLAFVSRGKTDKFLRARYFYPASDGTANQWETRDAQYKGQKKGACLVVKRSEESKNWIICEKGDEGTVYAIASGPAVDQPHDVKAWDYECTEAEGADATLLENKTEDPEDLKPLWVKKIDMEDLQKRLESMADEHNFKFQAVYIIDGSTRSEHSNAFFMGFLWFRKICLFDTLLKNLSVDSVCGIMGHEMGHCVMLHIPKNIAAAFIQTYAMLFLIAQVLYNKTLHAAFYVDTSKPENVTPWIGLIIVQTALIPLGFFLGLWRNYMTRKYEYEADQFAVERFEQNYAQDLVNGLKGLSMENKSHLNPHWLYVFLNHSHPTLTQRVRWIRGLSKKREGGKDIVKLDM